MKTWIAISALLTFSISISSMARPTGVKNRTVHVSPINLKSSHHTLQSFSAKVSTLSNRIQRTLDEAPRYAALHYDQPAQQWFEKIELKKQWALQTELSKIKEQSRGAVIPIIRFQRLLREIRLKIRYTSHVLQDHQSRICLNHIKAEGELLPLNDEEASRVYSRYLDRYLSNGGTVTHHYPYPFQSSDSSEIRLWLATSKAQSLQHEEIANNLEFARRQWTAPSTWIARKSFQLCPILGTRSVRILVPQSIQTFANSSASSNSTAGDAEIFYEDPSRWNQNYVPQYSNTDLNKYPVHAFLARYQKTKEALLASVKASMKDWALTKRTD
jgi:hypothetical protein